VITPRELDNRAEEVVPHRTTVTAKQATALRLILRWHRATGTGAPAPWLADQLGITREGVRSHLVALYRRGALRAPTSPAVPIASRAAVLARMPQR
jgi:predicted ArsR family transcriptional regulator